MKKTSQSVRRNFPKGSQIQSKYKNEPTPEQKKKCANRLAVEDIIADRQLKRESLEVWE